MSAPTNAQLSSYTSSLAGALTPVIRPYYELPQDAYHNDAHITLSAGIDPILLQLYDGTPCVRLGTLLGDLHILTCTMGGGSDRVFGDRKSLVKLDLHVMWPGYTAGTMSTKFNPAITTHAYLAKAVTQQIEWYMDVVSWTQSDLDMYQIGLNGIQTRHVLLHSIKHIDGDRWKAIIFIDNSMNV